MKRFPLSRVRFNAPNAWPQADLTHDSVMESLTSVDFNQTFPRYHFHQNEDGTLTPLNRVFEWQLAVFRVAGKKTFKLM